MLSKIISSALVFWGCLSLSTFVFSSDRFLSDLSECALSVDIKVGDEQKDAIEGKIERNRTATGKATIDVRSFIEIFPADDRLDAYRVYEKCLARKYKATSDTTISGDDKEKITIEGCIMPNSISNASLELRKGQCFISENKRYRSYIKLITYEAINYSNYKGENVACYLGETCSFGWLGSPTFHISINPTQNDSVVAHIMFNK